MESLSKLVWIAIKGHSLKGIAYRCGHGISVGGVNREDFSGSDGVGIEGARFKDADLSRGE